MDKRTNIPKCLFCDSFRSGDKEERKKHLKEKHHSILAGIAKNNNGDIDWAAGEAAAFFIQDDSEPQA